jgi:hypothetical protein
MGWKPGSQMFARYGIVDRSDMQQALERTERWEQEQANKKEFGHRTGIVCTEKGANQTSPPSKEVN